MALHVLAPHGGSPAFELGERLFAHPAPAANQSDHPDDQRQCQEVADGATHRPKRRGGDGRGHQEVAPRRGHRSRVRVVGALVVHSRYLSTFGRRGAGARTACSTPRRATRSSASAVSLSRCSTYTPPGYLTHAFASWYVSG